MDTRSSKTDDINQLCEVLGVDSNAYVTFSRSGKIGRSPHNVINQPASFPQAAHDISDAIQPRPAPALALSNTVPSEIAPRRMESPKEQPLARQPQRTSCATVRPTQFALLSLGGGTGKTTIAAVLGKILSARGHSVLLVDYSPYNTMHDLLGMQKEPGSAVSFAPGHRVLPLPVLSRFHAGLAHDDFESWWQLFPARTNFTFVDGMSSVVSAGRDVIGGGGRVLIPVLPNELSVLSTICLDKALDSSWPGRISYLLNRFDADQHAHLETRSRLQESLGARLLPFEITEGSATPSLADLHPHSGTWRSMNILADWFESSCALDYAGCTEGRQ